MKLASGVFLLSAAVSWGAAAPAALSQDPPRTFGPFTLSTEFDLDLIAALADGQGVDPGPHGDLRYRVEAEAVTEQGRRWGAALTLAARTRDGRRGHQPRRPESAGAVSGGAGLVTGLGGTGLEAEAAAGFNRAELFYKTALFEVFTGHGPTAAARERTAPEQALRLTSADGALIDPLGSGLSDTRASLSAPSFQTSVRTRRLAGLALAASFSPSGDPCGVERCLDAAYGHVDQIVSAAISFDRRSPQSGVRWRLDGGYEAGQAQAGPLSPALEDPWLVSLGAARQAGGVTVAVRALSASEGVASAEYSALSAAVAIERGDWLLDGQAGWGRSEVTEESGWTAQLGASRFAGRNGLVGAAIQLDGRGAAMLAEAGLRF